MPTREQLQQLEVVSDNILYPEAIAFIRRLVQEEDCMPLPASQVAGLLSISKNASYADFSRFIRHQRDRNWPDSRKDIKTFYTELEKHLTSIRNKRLRDEFHLVHSHETAKATQQETDAMMMLVAHDFIQHLIAENGLLTVEKVMQRTGRR